MTDAVLQTSRDLITQGSRSFSAASRLFPSRLREDAWMLYAWCRHCDDEVDGQVLGHGAVGLDAALARAKLNELKRLTEAALAGERMADPVFEAFQRVALRHDVPAREPLALLDGFAMDVDARVYRTLEDTLDYAWHVAGVVGVMMARIMGVRDRDVLRRAQDLGLAFQLTNIARDVVEDAKGGRVYLPRAWLTEAGVPQGAEPDPEHRAGVAVATGRLLDVAEAYYNSARWGLKDLDTRSAWAIATARRVYRQIGRIVARRGGQAWDSRASVSRPDKLWQVALAAGTVVRAKSLDSLGRAPERPALWTKI